MDDRTAGLVIRALRRRRGWRQEDVAERARVSRSQVSRAERGWFDQLTLRMIRRIFAALDARLLIAPRWHGAELERLLDEDHSVLVESGARRLEAFGWIAELEVTYSEFGERGSIDILGLLPAARAALVIEIKTDIASAEAMGRKLDEKARLAPGIVKARFGWTPTAVGRLIVMPETMRLRRLVQRHEVIGRMFPVDAVGARRWLRQPRGAFAGLWFLSDSRSQNTSRGAVVAQRRIKAARESPHAQRAPSRGPTTAQKPPSGRTTIPR